jgi:hypothetical protein
MFHPVKRASARTSYEMSNVSEASMRRCVAENVECVATREREMSAGLEVRRTARTPWWADRVKEV